MSEEDRDKILDYALKGLSSYDAPDSLVKETQAAVKAEQEKVSLLASIKKLLISWLPTPKYQIGAGVAGLAAACFAIMVVTRANVGQPSTSEFYLAQKEEEVAGRALNESKQLAAEPTRSRKVYKKLLDRVGEIGAGQSFETPRGNRADQDFNQLQDLAPSVENELRETSSSIIGVPPSAPKSIESEEDLAKELLRSQELSVSNTALALDPDSAESSLDDFRKRAKVQTQGDKGLAAKNKAAEIGSTFNLEKKDLNLASKPRDLFASQFKTEGLNFQSPHGYWSNSYVPGDTAYRYYESVVAEHDRSLIQKFLGNQAKLEQHSAQPDHRFDAPVSDAIELFVRADTKALSGKQRVLMQVGLQGAMRQAGARPAVNMALVLDIRANTSDQALASMRKVVQEYAKAQDVGDSFHLIFAGQPKALVASGESFRAGTIKVAFDSISKTNQLSPGTWDLNTAITEAGRLVSKATSPATPLGATGVVLITPHQLGGSTGQLSSKAHSLALSGVPVSTLGIGSKVNFNELSQIALRGQGARRSLSERAQAAKLVEQELTRTARTVARALRLNIVLAPDTKLIEVIDAQKLNQTQSAQAKQAEKAIDSTIAKQLGIVADRGEDQAGIQILIPAFYAGDRHTVLLDLMVEGPGAIADVSVKYKDLIAVNNGTARAQLSLPEGEAKKGAKELAVLKDLLSKKLSKQLIKAGQAVSRANQNEAQALIRKGVEMIQEFNSQFPELSNDSDLHSSLQMFKEYNQLFASSVLRSYPGQRKFVSSSLYYAGMRQILPS